MLERAGASYPGFYRGIVKDSHDPEDRGRIRAIVPQVSGEEITGWAWPVHGAITQMNTPYGTFYKTGNQTVAGGTVANVITGWVAADTNKTYVNGTKIHVQETGDYFLHYAAVMTRSNASSGDVDIWIRKNGVDIENSTTSSTLSGSSAELVVTSGLILDLTAGDYIEIVFSSPYSTTGLAYHAAGTSPTRPAMPSIVASISLIGKYKPQPGTQVWITYEGGDPNFPLWIGTA